MPRNEMADEHGIKDVGNITVRHILKEDQFFSQWLILSIALIAIGSIIGLNIFLEYERTLGREQERLLTSTKILQENIGQNLIATRDVLLDLRTRLPKGKADKDLITRLQALTDAIPGVSTISTIDASGTIRASNRTVFIGKNFSYRDYFKVPRQQPDEKVLYITPPFRSTLGTFTLNASVIIPGPKGEFAGVATAALDPKYFAPIMESILYAPDMLATIAQWEGFLFMIRPEKKELEGNKFPPGGFFYLHTKSGKEVTMYSGTTLITGEDRLLVTRTIRPAGLNMPTPLVVGASRSRSAIFAKWRIDSLKFAALYIVIVLISILGLYAFQRRQKHFSRQAAEAANALKQSEERYRLLAENASDIIWTTNLQMRLTYISPSVTRILGYTAEEALMRTMQEAYTPDSFAMAQKHFAEVMEREVRGENDPNLSVCLEIEAWHKNRHVVPLEISFSFLRDSNGHPNAILAIARDITDRKDTEKKLALFARELQRSNKELDDFSYIASHDLKEPLRGIHNYASFLLEDYADKIDDSGKDKLNTLVYLTKRLEGFINDLLKFSRIGRIDFTVREIEMDEVVKDALALLKPTLEKEHVSVRISRPLPVVKYDRYQLIEVFQNLISNAIKYNNKPDKLIEIGYTNNTNMAANNYIFYVQDNGIGIDKKYFDSIFTIFKRLHARDKFGGGTGAGLTIVKKIIEHNGGKMWLESILSEGTTFYFTLQGEKNE
jgi:PAS domain S-box-containing protein